MVDPVKSPDFNEIADLNNSHDLNRDKSEVSNDHSESEALAAVAGKKAVEDDVTPSNIEEECEHFTEEVDVEQHELRLDQIVDEFVVSVVKESTEKKELVEQEIKDKF